MQSRVAIIAFRHSSALAVLLTDGCAAAKQQPYDLWETCHLDGLAVAPGNTEQEHRLESTFYEDIMVYIPRTEVELDLLLTVMIG